VEKRFSHKWKLWG